MSFTKEIKKGLKKTEKVIRKARDDIEDFANTMSDNDYRAEKCFTIFKKEGIKVCSNQTGKEFRSAQEFLDTENSHLHREFPKKYDLKLCLKAFAKRGAVKCDSLEVNKFSSEECFKIFKENDITICQANTNTHIVQQTDMGSLIACTTAIHPCQIAPKWEKNIYNWDGVYNVETCQDEFGAKDIVRCAGEQDHEEL